MLTLTPAQQTQVQIQELQLLARKQAFIESLTPDQRNQLTGIVNNFTLSKATPYQASGADQATDFFYMLTGGTRPPGL